MALQVGFILLFGFLILLFLGVPIAIGLAIPSIAAMVITLYTFDVAAFSGAQALFTNMSSFTLNAIPFFVLSGVMMSHGGISRRLINFAKLLIGRLPGSLAHTNILSNMLFGAISGSAVASATSIGGIFHGSECRFGTHRASYPPKQYADPLFRCQRGDFNRHIVCGRVCAGDPVGA